MSWCLVVTTYVCERCCHSWPHTHFGSATMEGVHHPIAVLCLPPTHVEVKLTHYVEESRRVPLCHRCVDLTTLVEGYPPQWSPAREDRSNRPTSRPSLRKPRERPSPEAVRKLLLGD